MNLAFTCAGEVCLGLLGIPIQHNGLVIVAEITEAVVALPSVGPHNGTSRHVLFDELGEFFRTTTRHKAQPKSPGVHPTREWRIWNAVSYRLMPSWSWNWRADCPGVWAVTRYVPQNHIDSGVWLDRMTVPAVSDTLA